MHRRKIKASLFTYSKMKIAYEVSLSKRMRCVTAKWWTWEHFKCTAAQRLTRRIILRTFKWLFFAELGPCLPIAYAHWTHMDIICFWLISACLSILFAAPLSNSATSNKHMCGCIVKSNINKIEHWWRRSQRKNLHKQTNLYIMRNKWKSLEPAFEQHGRPNVTQKHTN